MAKKNQQTIIRRAAAEAKQSSHGGNWKIAYADFMTAMMALFMVLWLVSIATPKQRQGIAERFRMPLKVAIVGGEKSSMTTSVIPAGGTDPRHADGEVSRSSSDDEGEAEGLERLKQRLDQVIDAKPELRQLRPQLLIDIIGEGLRIQIVDSRNRPMFDLSSAAVQPYMRAILREIGPVLNELPNKITLSGHTDAVPYAQGEKSYSNWELSADRANASRRELIAGGMSDQKVLRTMGVASTMHLNKDDPLDPVNRRISIIVLNRRAQAQIERENASPAAASIRNQPGGAAPVRDLETGAAPVTRPLPAVR